MAKKAAKHSVPRGRGRPKKSAAARERERIATNAARRARTAELKEIAKRAKENAARAPASEPAHKKGAAHAFEPTKHDRARVEMMSGFGLRADEIALIVVNPHTDLPLDEKTLRRHFARELDVGPVKAHSMVAESLYKKAVGNGHAAVTAAIWFSKCRMGWRERVHVDVEVKSGVLVAPGALTPEEWIKVAAERSADAKEPGTEENP